MEKNLKIWFLTHFYFTLVIAIILLCLLFIVYKWAFKPKRHHYKINKSKEIIAKLNTFEGDYKEARIINYLKKIDPYIFEELLLSAFEQRGFKIQRNKRYSGDGGIDGTVYNKENKKLIIQAKRYKNTIYTGHITRFSEKISVNNAIGGYFIHTGKTPKNTYAIYKQSNIIIISGSKLVDLITTINPIYDLI